ncbi:hypothetical protein [Urbifossiella limnaea]|uniref:hypothetical protein n=1 Tax=Urbifossiella limnaea TaxID=2528023 RepID=UPI0011A2D6ED|nr:hypothetical protein [Urbifossiella limnaea]
MLFDNMDLRMPELQSRIGGRPGKVRSYKMISVYVDDQGRLEHYGSGPNFQGGCLTLCTCAHQIRTEKHAADWEGCWLAGFTSPRLCDRTWLFYLAQVGAGYPTAAGMWTALPALQGAKSTRQHRLGDMFEPRLTSSFSNPCKSTSYYPPMVGHSHRRTAATDDWKKDIEFSNAQFGRHAAYLVADPAFTFLWQTPALFLEHHARNQGWESVDVLLQRLIAVH